MKPFGKSPVVALHERIMNGELYKFLSLGTASMRRHDEAMCKLSHILHSVYGESVEPYRHLNADQLDRMGTLLLTGHFTVGSAYYLVTKQHNPGSVLEKLSTGELTINQIRDNFGLKPVDYEAFDSYRAVVKGLDER